MVFQGSLIRTVGHSHVLNTVVKPFKSWVALTQNEGAILQAILILQVTPVTRPILFPGSHTWREMTEEEEGA